MSDDSETSSSSVTRRRIQKIAEWIEQFDYTCYKYQTRTFACQGNLRFFRSFVIYRWIVMLLWLTTIVVTLCDLGKPPSQYSKDYHHYLKYFIFISNHALIIAFVQVSLGAFIATRSAVSHNVRHRPLAPDPVGGIELVYWKLHELSTSLAIAVSTAYWLMIHPQRKTPSDLNNYLTHLVNSIYCVADWLITGLPQNLSDAWIGWLYGIWYTIFTFVYWHFGGTARVPLDESAPTREIYPGCTDWERVGVTLVCFFWLGCLYCMSHVVLCFLYLLLKKLQPPIPVIRLENSEIDQPRVVRFRRRESFL
ncbi:Hypothetical protein NTJ_08254 [Nesidiocoris tenuis]|uniref:Protein rolling stone n=1 Tax=Nesidiocoris tenuis TaxID=355587 RepID=A0ABN7AWV9_9HEMI|nr:Hypothetical protein NTJ_08254 [Nesidiocoris tenuis]